MSAQSEAARESGVFIQTRFVRAEPYGIGARSGILNLAELARARAEISSWPGYCVTPLHNLDTLAAALGVRAIQYKDEGGRFGLGSFKALGGAYAVLRLLQAQVLKETGVAADSREIMSGRFVGIARNLTVTCATDGNHGRSVAWGASLMGCGCVIFVHERVSPARRAAIAKYGADVRVVAGNYDDAVREAARQAALSGWQVVSDTSYEGYVSVPCDVMQGYGLMVAEALEQMPEGVQPTHVFVQAGVGGLAAAVCATLWESLGEACPVVVVVEPDKAACLFDSAVAGAPQVVHGDLDTIMAGLACGEVSTIAWEILKDGANAFVLVEDARAAECMRVLAAEPGIEAGESAVAGLAGLMKVSASAAARGALNLNQDSVVLLFGTEGATDPEAFEKIVGRKPMM
jgi:diaminopropionate ammonia-lyase